MDLDLLEIPKQKVNQLNKAGIEVLEDLVKYLPRKYYDFRSPAFIKDIEEEDYYAVVGRVISVKESGNCIYAKIKDDKGLSMGVSWFHQKYVKRILDIGEKYIFCGKISISKEYNNYKTMTPMFFNRDIDKFKKIIPIYKKIKGMSDSYLLNLIHKSLNLVGTGDYLELEVKNSFNLVSEYDAFKSLHKPLSMEDIKKGQDRFVFDDLFLFNFKLKAMKKAKEKSAFTISRNKTWHKLYNSLPFELTTDQKKTLKNIFYRIKNNEILDDLVQGDVGSGKTIVAIFLMLLMAENGYQCCLLAPTDILAQQHYEDVKKMFKDYPLEVAFLSGSLKAKEKRDILKRIKSGEVHLIIGTHAAIQKSVEFNNLSLVIVDEQHRFGVEQRQSLVSRNNQSTPHKIVMSATPIPRTLSLALYGDNITVHTIKTRPKGRKPIITKAMNKDTEVNQFMLQEIKKGHQCYVVCPLVDESDSEVMKNVISAKTVFKDLKTYFNNNKNVNIGLINGKMKKADIDEQIKLFTENKIQILVSTTIVEVGVNVPNSTVMVIKNAERFGLAQLHQLRGRVGRSDIQSYCLLQSPKNDKKVEVMCRTSDGFEIAKEDLMLRGPGDFLGIKQSGQNKYIMLMLAYPKLYEQINNLNNSIYNDKKRYNHYKFINEYDLR
ncbi:MAG: ATP-dependent DNA helicase RecG [Candidatus Woesearchaeota archaeon]